MATFAEMQAELAKDLGDSNLTDEIKQAINDSIEHYQRTRFPFNQGNVTETTVIGTPDYAFPSGMLLPDHLQYLHASHNRILRLIDYEHFLVLNSDSTAIGPPSFYAVFGETVFLYPIPDEVTTLTFSGVVQLLPSPLSADGDTNAWTTRGYEMIAARARALIKANRQGDFEGAALQDKLSTSRKRELLGDLSRIHRPTGSVRRQF